MLRGQHVAAPADPALASPLDTTTTAQLDQALALAHAIKESVGDGIAVFAADGRLLAYNARLLELWPIPESLMHQVDAAGEPAELIDHVLGLLVSPKPFAESIDRLRLDGQTVVRDDVELTDGRIFERFTSPVDIGDPNVSGRIWCFRDVTEQRFFTTQYRRLFELERHSRARIGLLYRLASELGRAASLDEVFEPALDALCVGLSVRRASVLLDDDDGVLGYRAWRSLSEEYRTAVAELARRTPVSNEAEPVLVEDTDLRPDLAPYRLAFEAEGIRSFGMLPLLHEDRFFGKLMFYFREPHHFESDEVRLGMAIAAQVAQAISRRLAEARSEHARAVAEDAARAREDLLAVVAHDLRNPLVVIQFRAQRILSSPPRGEEGESLHNEVASIRRGALHMRRIIDDLLDAAAIDAGRLSVLREPLAVAEVVDAALELVRPLAEHRKLDLTARVDVGEALWDCDRQRIVQVLSNLVGNAIKFSPEGSSVRLEATANEREILLAVSDHGPGIAPADRERVFERGVRVGTNGNDGLGLGLGLFVAKGLVIAHGGRIWIDGDYKGGTRIVFTLPRC